MHARKAVGLVIVLLVVASGRSGKLLAADNPGDRQTLEARLKTLLVERVATARQCKEAYRAAFEAETVPLDSIVWAINALWKAELAAANIAGERTAAHVRHIQNLAPLESKIEELNKVGARGGEDEKLAAIKYSRESAEIALLDACMAAGQEYPKFDLYPGNAPSKPANR